jgi:hypothetical protein
MGLLSDSFLLHGGTSAETFLLNPLRWIIEVVDENGLKGHRYFIISHSMVVETLNHK